MTKSLSFGFNPTGTALTGVVVKAPAAADLGVIEEAPGILKFKDLTTPRNQPTTIRLQQKLRPNVYAGTTIESVAYLADKAGTDTIIEVLGVAVEDDVADTFAAAMVPYRMALSFTVPNGAATFTNAQLVEAVKYLLGFLASEDDTELAGTGISRILNGVLRRD